MSTNDTGNHRLLDSILGAPDSFSLKNRIFNAVALATAVAGLLIFITDLNFNIKPGVYLFSLAFTLIQIVFYVLGRRKKCISSVIWSLILVDLTMVVYGWLMFKGLIGVASVFAIALIVVLPMLLEKKAMIAAFVLCSLTISILFIVEYRNPRETGIYVDPRSHLLDFYLTEIFLAGGLFILIWMLVQSYQLQQKRIHSLNRSLEIINSELENRNVELEKVVSEKSEALEAYELLMKEMNHRIKNNLATVSGLLNIQARIVRDPESKLVLQQSSMRISAITDIHEMLTVKENLHHIPIAKYFTKLLADIRENFDTETQPVEMKTRFDEITVDMNKFLPLALITNELVTNTYKYAFSNRKQGQIRISVTQQEQIIKLTVSDNGVGLPKDFDPDSSKSLGLTIIQALVKQISGTFEFNSSNLGTTFSVKFTN